jgi:mannose/fructose/N-acetylgalactosamine-specific phosphotransferase system component IIC
MSMLCGLIASMLSGMAYMLVAYIKSEEKFNKYKFTRTLVIGAFVGLVMGYYNIGFMQAYDYLISLGIITIIDQILALIMKKMKKKRRKDDK